MTSLITNINLYDIDTESAVLSAMMIGNEPTGKAIEQLHIDHFHDHKHKIIFKALKQMYEQDINIDALTLMDYIKRHNVLKSESERDYLTDLIDIVVSDTNLQYHTDIVREKYKLREIAKTNAEIDRLCQMPDKSSREIIDLIEQKLSAIDYQHKKEGLTLASKYTNDVLDEISDQMVNKRPRGIQTGFNEVDNIIHGMLAGHLIILAGRPGMGKTSFVGQMAINIARSGKNVALFSLEMTTLEMMHRLISVISGVNAESILTGQGLTAEDIKKITDATDEIHDLGIYIDDSPNCTPIQAKSKIRRAGFNGKKIDVAFFDHIGLMHFQGNKRYDNENLEITNISRSLKIVSKELGIPIVVVSQLNRLLEQREDKRPRLADLRSSGAIEQDADKVLFMYRDDYYRKENSYKPGIAEIIVAKNRNGRIGYSELFFDQEHIRFLPKMVM